MKFILCTSSVVFASSKMIGGTMINAGLTPAGAALRAPLPANRSPGRDSQRKLQKIYQNLPRRKVKCCRSSLIWQHSHRFHFLTLFNSSPDNGKKIIKIILRYIFFVQVSLINRKFHRFVFLGYSMITLLTCELSAANIAQ